MGSGSASAGAVASGAPDVGLAKGMVLPLEAYMESYDQEQTISAALAKAETSCMAGYGFSYSPDQQAGSAPLSSDDANMPRRYGITDRAQAAQYGYHVAGDATSPQPPAPLSPQEHLVLTGASAGGRVPASLPTYAGRAIPAGGCAGAAGRKLGVTFDTSLADKLAYDSLNQSQASPRVQTALRQWSQCMHSHGYEVDVPFHAPTLAPSSAGPSASRQEIAVALADVDCKASADLVRTWFTVECAVEQQQIEQHQLALTEERDQIAAAVRRSVAAAA
ncbi:hypothetical protein [Streptacidiphilus rugosus]|uniref:hypothetical protein n=1 Tax=Streptacidiphilus rugosus TaxID=405783 RepID=UPI000B330D6B|nr:hypothetical protein [Streptacidiphilus rugosus]